jgi:ribosomal protein L7/L12
MTPLQLALLASIVIALVWALRRRDETTVMPQPQTGPPRIGTDPSIESLVVAGRKIEAIKQLRAETGLGLREAKDEVDAMVRRLTPR